MQCSPQFCPPPPLMLGRVGVDFDLLVDPVRLGWYRSLRILEHVISFISKIQARTGVVQNIRSRFCSETDLEKVFFLYESRVIRQTLKSEQIAFNLSGKTHKKSRISVIVIVCIMTGATNILAL